MRFSDLNLVMQIVTALISAWITMTLVAVVVINVYETRRNRSVLRRAAKTFLSLLPIWLLAEGYVAALARWFTERKEISPLALLDLLWALAPWLNILYAWDWLFDILVFNGRLLGALFGLPGV